MGELGKVVEVSADGKFATVRFERKSTCDKCGMCAFGPKDTSVNLTVENKLNAKAGDIAEIDVAGHLVLKLSLIVYFIPLAIAILGMGIGLLLHLPEWACFVLFLGCLAIGFGIVSLIDKKYLKKSKTKPVMVRVYEGPAAAQATESENAEPLPGETHGQTAVADSDQDDAEIK